MKIMENLEEKYALVLEELKGLEFVRAIIIFGSYAKGRVKPLSDLDVCVITYSNYSREEIEEVYSYGNKELDIVLFDDLPLPHQYEVMEWGKIFYQENDLTRLKIYTRNQWIDFRPRLRRIYKKRGYPVDI